MSSVPRARALVALAAAAAYLPSFFISEFMRDDQWLIEGNPLLRQGLAGLGRLLTTGYVEAVEGASAPIQEWRPLLVLSYFFNVATTGFSSQAMHGLNVLLHAAVGVLLFDALRARLGQERAAWAAGLFAVMPVHVEAVSYVTSRSELLCAAFMLLAWRWLDAGRLGAGLAAFAGALGSKEHGALFPLFYAAADWTFAGRRPWDRGRRPLYGALAGVLAVYAVLRVAILGRPFHGGVPYFAGTPLLEKLLALARFWAEDYGLAAATGLGLCPVFPRPGAAGPLNWLCLAALAAAAAAAVRAWLRRKSWGFWALGPCLFLLPTSHLIIPLDTLGAQRLLYFPTVGLAVGLSALRPRLLLAGLALWYGLAAARAQRAWSSELSFYEAALSCSPDSAQLHSALGAYWLKRGRPDDGERWLRKALELDPRSSHAHYNLARWSWEKGRHGQAEQLALKSLSVEPGSCDARIVLALALEAQGRLDEAAARLEEALALRPWAPEAHFNLGRIHALAGRVPEAVASFERFLELSPSDPDAPAAARLIAQMKGKPIGSR